MFSAPARRAAPAHPESPRTDKKPRPAPASDSNPATGEDTPAAACDVNPATSTLSTAAAACEPDVELRERPRDDERIADRLSASDFYTVTEDVTPQPFKGEYFIILTVAYFLYRRRTNEQELQRVVITTVHKRP